ncbi:SH3 and cysteine-rich domain-containing protein 2-like [Engraulis encrasicolus]|uniref:SH3 and cysteine-rich domain-containing protein 2-like n=1 Tax=Engraulis encrasicolus TaxID=184585 RepID=UPI002FD6B07C
MTEINEVENESQPHGTLQRSPSTMSITPVSKLQRLKCSLKFMRSKSVENFFQRSYSDARLPSDIESDGPPPASPTLLSATPFPCGSTLSLSPSVLSPNPSLSPVLTPANAAPSPQPAALQPPPAPPPPTHCLLEHVFRRPTSCQLCKHVIAGNSKQGLRCKTCKMGAHLWCSSELSQQPCQGRSGMFKRNFSSPLLGNEQLGVVKETQPNPDPLIRMDPVYAALRYGTTLAHMSRSSFGSVSESPTRSLGEGGDDQEEMEEKEQRDEEEGEERREKEEDEEREEEEGLTCAEEEESEEPAQAMAADSSSGGGGKSSDPRPQSKADPEEPLKYFPLSEPEKTEETEDAVKVPRQVHSIHTYVALYKFLPQEPNDLELHPGDRVQVTDDSNEEWWKGRCGERVGFFPANFVQRVRPGERVWRVTQGSQGNRGMGHMPVKEAQICVGKCEDSAGFLKLSSGKKRGLVAANSLEEI